MNGRARGIAAMLLLTVFSVGALSGMALEEMGLTPGDGDVAVTGASGGVGSTAVALLARASVRVVSFNAISAAVRNGLLVVQALGSLACRTPTGKTIDQVTCIQAHGG